MNPVIGSRIQTIGFNIYSEDQSERLQDIIRSTLLGPCPGETEVYDESQDSVSPGQCSSLLSQHDVIKMLSVIDDEPSYIDEGSVDGFWLGSSAPLDDDPSAYFSSEDVEHAIDADGWSRLMSMDPIEQALWDTYHNSVLVKQAPPGSSCEIQQWLQEGSRMPEEVAQILTTATAQQVIDVIGIAPKMSACSSALKQFLCFGIRMYQVSTRCLCSNHRTKNLYASLMRYTPAASKVIEISCSLIKASSAQIEQTARRFTQKLWRDEVEFKIGSQESAKYHDMNRLQLIAMQMIRIERGAMLPFQLIRSVVRDLVSLGAFALVATYLEGKQYRFKVHPEDRCELKKLGMQYLTRLGDQNIKRTQAIAFKRLSDLCKDIF